MLRYAQARTACVWTRYIVIRYSGYIVDNGVAMVATVATVATVAVLAMFAVERSGGCIAKRRRARVTEVAQAGFLRLDVQLGVVAQGVAVALADGVDDLIDELIDLLRCAADEF